MTSRKAVRRSVPKGELPAFTPVPRKVPRHDGWTPERQRAFIEALADTGCVAIAARMVNMSQPSVYQLRRQPGAESFRAAMDAAQTLGLQAVKDEAFHRAMHGQLVPVFVGGKLMGFRRKKNDGLLIFILRHYGQDASGRKTTVNYFSSRATAGAAAATNPPRDGEGDHAQHGGGGPAAVSAAEASTTTVRTVISGNPGQSNTLAREGDAAALINAFEGVALDAEAQAEIYRTLTACAERRRTLEDDPENDPDCDFVHPGEAGDFLGELEGGTEEDWVEYRPEGEHRWESLGEGGQAAEIDEVLRGIEERKALPSPAHPEAIEGPPAHPELACPGPRSGEGPPPAEPDPGDPMFDWRNWSDGGYTPPAPSSPQPPTPNPRAPKRAYKKRQPKPPFTPPDKARKAAAVAEVAAERRELAAGEAERRRRRKERET